VPEKKINSGAVDAYTAGAQLHVSDRAPNAMGLASIGKNEDSSHAPPEFDISTGVYAGRFTST
jgi:hypothetical protein